MTIELLQTLSLVLYIIVGVFFLVAILLFIILGAQKLQENRSGRNEKKENEIISCQNECIENEACQTEELPGNVGAENFATEELKEVRLSSDRDFKVDVEMAFASSAEIIE